MTASTSDVQNPLNCPSCRDLFKDPVTTSCGHSFCMKCIERFWDQESVTQVFSCPTCRKTFNQRPDLSRSTVLAEIVEEMKQDVPAIPGDVKCDVCKGRKFKAVKSCKVCLASFCQTHLKPHYESKAFKNHKLANSLANLQQYICSEHHKALDIYCYDDQKCICVWCMGQHRGHKTVSAEIEMDVKKEELKIKNIIFDRLTLDINRNLQTLKMAAESHERSAEEEIGFQSHPNRQNTIQEEIQDYGEINDYIQKCEQEIVSLKIQSSDLNYILDAENHIYFFENYSASNVLTTFDNVMQSASQLRSQIEEFSKDKI